jgi:chemotaxis protein methyltransferase CheR
MSTVGIAPAEIALWTPFVHSLCGVSLDASKAYLFETRLGGLLAETGCSSFTEFYARAKADLSGALQRRIIDAITTNETSFFRDTSPFDLLRFKIIPELIDRRNKQGVRPVPIRVWSAACSTGQEAYSTAIVLRELLHDGAGYDLRILGTDISDKAVAQASYGHFSQLEISRGMPADRVARWFTAAGDRFKVRDEVRALATFRRMNLLEPFSFPALFDIVFCRNVAIYFNEADKTRLFRGIGRCMAKDGALIIGSTESIGGLCPEFEPKRYLRSVFYQLKP